MVTMNMNPALQIAADEEPGLQRRLEQLFKQFQLIFNQNEPNLIVRSPGRAEIIGNHTDYNNGYALAAAINRNTLALFKRRDDRIVRIHSMNFPYDMPIVFSITGKIPYSTEYPWSNYVRGVVVELQKSGYAPVGADILVDSTIPSSGGTSSSAALEVAIIQGFISQSQLPVSKILAAQICQTAENSFVKSPCGFLDQGAVALSQRNKLLFIDFKPNANQTFETKLIEANLHDANLEFIICIDPRVKRNLGESGYPERRAMCENSISFFQHHLTPSIQTLRDVSIDDLAKVEAKLRDENPTMLKRVTHVIQENQRVKDAIKCLDIHNFQQFGQILTASGHSALELYELNMGVPELTHLYKCAIELPGVLGARNMGGGFSANIIALVETKKIDSFKSALQHKYAANYSGRLEFIEFKPAQGVESYTI